MAKFYLAGPFWNEGCQEFFDNFIKRMEETRMDNSKYVGVESKASQSESPMEAYKLSSDSFFAPGHFEVNFQKMREEYSASDMKRVLNQVLDLDLEKISSCDSMIAYLNEPDLGTLVEIGYFLSINLAASPTSYYNRLKKKLILEGGNDKIYEAIKAVYLMRDYLEANYVYEGEPNGVLVIDGISSIYNWNNTKENKKFNVAALRLGNYDEPLNAIMAGVLYSREIPFVTYTTDDSVRNNVMMIAAAMGHLNINTTKLEKVERTVMAWTDNIHKNIWSNDSIESAKEIK